MYLKRLELYGFKTFADHTDLEFGPGMTAIVGPNGSGKSNISDAILWVLGEQAMKALRSSKSVDVIFNGSDARKASGLAEVHLTLDNSSGTLPTDFTEVTITRRIFRSGESEYLINRVPVRLRDVQDLFLDTGIGKQSYSIISQGEVDAVLSSRSEERRALFEEVAGINKYKHRKKEALRKLEQTRQNLLRVSDIISELDSQLGPLSEQSEKAKEYQVYNEELTSLQLSLLVVQYTGLQSSLTRSKEREAELQKELDELRHNLQQSEVKEATLRAELQKLEDELDERRGVEGRFANAVQAAENKVELLKQQEANARKERERLQQERQDWQEQSGKFDAEIAAAEVEQERLRHELEALDAELAATDAALKDVAAAVNDITKQIQQKRGAYLEALDRVSRVRNDLARVESLLRTSEGRTSRIAAEQAEVAEKLKERLAALTTAQARVKECQQIREQLAAKRTEATKARQGMIETQGALRRDESRAREELAGLRSRQRTLQELEESHEGYFPGVRAVMNAAGAGHLSGWYAPVSELIDVPAELELAIEVALGANLQDIATDTERSARAAIDFLKRNRAGRATFLALDLINPDRKALAPNAPGILGVAMDLVTYDAENDPIVQHLLGRVIVAQDLDSALALAKSNTAKGWKTIVTLEGEVVTPARSISGGSQGKGSGLLKRKRELQELTDKVETLEKKANSLQRKVQQTAADIQRFDAEITSLAKEGERAASAIAEAERSVATIQRDVSALKERATTLDKEAAWIATEVGKARAEEAKYVETLHTLEHQQQAVDAEITAAEQSLAGGQQERDAITERYSTLRLKLTELRGEMQRYQAAARRAGELRDSLGARLAQNAHAVEDLATKIESLAAQQREAVAELLRLREAYARSTGELDSAKAQRAKLLDTIAANLEEQKTKREAIEECQGRLHRADLRTTQVETEIGFLENQFFEDYRLTTDQAVARAKPVESRGVAVARLKELQAIIEELGAVNIGAIEEFDRVRERLSFLTTQRGDLEEARESLTKVITEIDATCKEKFLAAFAAISREFQGIFEKLFGGGKTELSLAEPDNILESGIDINVVIPGKRNQNLVQLSGGERALTALALLFAMLRVKPSPFVVLDEIDAPLDEANVGRYCDVLREFCRDTQFLTVTHNKAAMEAADVLYGVTMEKAGVSKIVSVRLSDSHFPDRQLSFADVSKQNGPFANEERHVPTSQNN
ncbi:MAG TPA: chromosome segregation protein SMC [Armatimonadota bacterium]|nr:chromosome segregation protein SMC [Armatimonadota bacterium]